jgi:hypothetical protein
VREAPTKLDYASPPSHPTGSTVASKTWAVILGCSLAAGAALFGYEAIRRISNSDNEGYLFLGCAVVAVMGTSLCFSSAWASRAFRDVLLTIVIGFFGLGGFLMALLIGIESRHENPSDLPVTLAMVVFFSLVGGACLFTAGWIFRRVLNRRASDRIR